MKSETFWSLMFIVAMTVIAVYGSCYPHANEARTIEAVTNSGFKDVVIDGGTILRCGGDWYQTEFNAVNSEGRRVRGVCCCGFWTKGCTIRW